MVSSPQHLLQEIIAHHYIVPSSLFFPSSAQLASYLDDNESLLDVACSLLAVGDPKAYLHW